MSYRADYCAASLITCIRPRWTNGMRNFRCIRAEPVCYRDQLSAFESRYQRILRTEQKNASLLPDIMGSFTQPGDNILDAWCGTMAAGQTCFLLQQNRSFVRYESDSDWLAEAMKLSAKPAASQPLDKDSDLTAWEDALRAAESLIDVLNVIVAKKQDEFGLFQKRSQLCKRVQSTFCILCRFFKRMKSCLKISIIFLCQIGFRSGTDI